MVIGDERFAGQVIDSRGRSWKFDAIECMAAFLADMASEREPAKAWVADGLDGWLPASRVHFVVSSGIRSPMGAGILPVAELADAESLAAEVSGEILTWDEVLARHGRGHLPHAYGSRH